VSDAQLRDYIAGLGGGAGFLTKDLRTARANLIAIAEVATAPMDYGTTREYQAAVMAVASKVSTVLCNKPAQAVESYISPTAWIAMRRPTK
jgi:hypothetical protein